MSITPGHRVLNEQELDLITMIKASERSTLALFCRARDHVVEQTLQATLSNDSTEYKRIADAEPARWASIARTHFQEGYMALVRAIAQPTQ